jgi:hypothetical protein
VDALTHLLMDLHEGPGDKLYLFALRNVFAVPPEARDAVALELVSAESG